MYGPPGRAYVYLVYGMHHCLNVVTGPEGVASAVLVRAVEPVHGLARMHLGHRPGRRAADGSADNRLASGPGLVCRSFGIDLAPTGIDLCDPASSVRIERRSAGERLPDGAWTARIGVAYAGEPWASLAWRIVDRSSPSLSRPVGAGGRAVPDPVPAAAEG